MSDPRSRRANPPQAIKKHPDGTLFVVHEPDWSKVWAANVSERDAKRVKNMVANRRLSRAVTYSPMPEDEVTLEKMHAAIASMVEGGAEVGVNTPLAVEPEASGTAPAASADVSTGAGTADRSGPPPATEDGKCSLCGEAMPAGEEMFKFHGYSGPCPRDAASVEANYQRRAELGRKGGETSHETGGRTTAAPMLEVDGVASDLASVSDDVGDLAELLGEGETVDDMIRSASDEIGGEDLPPLDGDSK